VLEKIETLWFVSKPEGFLFSEDTGTRREGWSNVGIEVPESDFLLLK
jgi:hypothetical protein